MLNTDKAWKIWGRQDPYFGVLADEKFTAGNIDQHRDEFFATGRRFISRLLKRYELHFGALPRRQALDYGCGVGRLTLPMAAEFSSVVALDISPSMLAEAEANARQGGVTNARYDLADDALSNAPEEFDFVNCHAVLQHIPVRRGLPILYRLIDKVSPGGGFHVHLSIRTDPPMSRLLYWSSANIPGVKIVQNIQNKRPWLAPAMQMNNYPLRRILSHLTSQGMTEYLVLTEQHSKFITCSLIGKKAAPALDAAVKP